MIQPPSSAFAQAIEAADVLAGFQALLARCPTDADRKMLILDAHGYGALSVPEAMVLISANLLENA